MPQCYSSSGLDFWCKLHVFLLVVWRGGTNCPDSLITRWPNFKLSRFINFISGTCVEIPANPVLVYNILFARIKLDVSRQVLHLSFNSGLSLNLLHQVQQSRFKVVKIDFIFFNISFTMKPRLSFINIIYNALQAIKMNTNICNQRGSNPGSYEFD